MPNDVTLNLSMDEGGEVDFILIAFGTFVSSKRIL